MRKITVLLVLGASVFLAQCAKKTSAPIAATTAPKVMADAEKVAEVKRTYTAEQMNEGMAIFRSSCNKCHKYFEPETLPVVRWERVLPSMSMKSNLSTEQAAKVRAWVLSNARVG